MLKAFSSCRSAIDMIIEILSFSYLTLAQYYLLYYVADIISS